MQVPVLLVCGVLPLLALFVPLDITPTLLKRGSMVGSITLVLLSCLSPRRGGLALSPSLDTRGMDIYVLDEPTSDDIMKTFFPSSELEEQPSAPFPFDMADVGGVLSSSRLRTLFIGGGCGVNGIIVILINCNIITMLHLCSLLISGTRKLWKHYLK